MNRLLQCFRLSLCAGLVLFPALLRAQTISSAAVTAIGVNWIGAVSDPVVINGNGFAPGNVPAITSVKFNGTPAGFSVQTDSQINVSGIPVGATTGLISIIRSNLTTVFSPQIFQIVPGGPYITGFNPVGGSSTTVLLTGIRFNNVQGTNGVLFNGKKPVSLLSQTTVAMQVITPPNVISGPITIMANTGIIGTNTTSSNYFGPSVITSFSPSAGRAGTNVVISARIYPLG